MKIVLAFLSILVSATAFAQDTAAPVEPISTDRPGGGDSPDLVSQGFLQIETGGQYTVDNQGMLTTKEITYNSSLLRYGLLDNLELRLGIDTRKTRFESDERKIGDLNGLSPLLIGAKIRVVSEKGWLPQIAFLGNLRLPFTASDDYKPETTAVAFKFVFNHSLSEKSSFGYNLGARIDAENSELNYTYTLSYSRSLSKNITVFTDVYGDFPENSSANHLWDAGFTYLANNDLQFDITVGSGITEGQDLLLGAGLSYRFRNL